MRKTAFVLLLLLGISISPLYAANFPKPVGFINDFAGVIDEGSEAQMEGISTAVERTTGAEIAVVTVESIEPYASIQEYAIELATEWGIGKEGVDNGILMVLAMKEKQVRLEVGYGLEGAIPDGLAGQIIDQSVIPPLQSGDYGGGLLKGVEAVAGIIAKEYDVDLGSYDLRESRQYTRTGVPGLGFLIFIIIALLFGGGRFIFPLLFLGTMTSRGFFGGGFGSGGSSFGGGSFGGFSGGGFGGGGATRGF
jgi:uncharacterized protein